MNQESKELSEMLTQVGITARIVGVSKLTELLKTLQKTQKDITEEELSKSKQIIEIVCKNFGVTFEDFFKNKKTRERKQALSVICYILNKIIKLEYQKISFIVKKSTAVVSVSVNEISNLNPYYKFNKTLKEKLDLTLLEVNNKLY